jgi:hypothetical protein
VAVTLTALCATAWLVAALSEPSVRSGALLLLVFGSACVGRGHLRRRESDIVLVVSARGDIAVSAAGFEAEPAQVLLRSRHLIVLKAGGRIIPVWSDTLPAPAWRRLAVACRWGGASAAALDQNAESAN